MNWRPTPARVDEREPLPVAASLDRLASSLGAPRAGVLTAVFSGWADLVGPDVAAHARPISLREGVLVVSVDQPGWATQLRYLSAELLRRVADAAGVGSVTEVQVRVL